MPSQKPSSPTRTGAALVGFLAGILLVLSGFVLGIVADRQMGGTAPLITQAVVLPTFPAVATDTVPAGRPTSTPRPAATPVPTVTPRPSDPPISLTDAKNTTPKELKDQFDIFWQAFQILENNFYYRPLDEQKLIYGALKGMYNSAGDDYTVFLEPKTAQDRKDAENGQFVGIGVYIEQKDGELRITSVIPNGPAAAAGLQSGDVVLSIDGKSLAGLSLEDQRTPIRGPENSIVTLTVRRAGEANPLDIPITRKRIVIPAVTLDVRPDGIGVLKITGFNDHYKQELDDALKQAQDKKVKGLVLDLRDNGGGYVDGARQLLGRFLPKDSLAMLEDRRPTGGNLSPITVIENGPVFDLPLVVLVNGGTASASEITAGALQDYNRATLIGTKTFGKGSEQSVTQFKDGSSSRVTIANWYTPKQRIIQKEGLVPDMVVEAPKDQRGTAPDPQLGAATDLLRTKIASSEISGNSSNVPQSRNNRAAIDTGARDPDDYRE